MSSIFKNMFKDLPAQTSVAAEGVASSEYHSHVDTGSYALNAVLGGSLFAGMPDNKVTTFAGESSVGKTFFVLGIVSQFLKANPKGVCVYFDTESAVTNAILKEQGIDLERLVKSEPETIEAFRQSALKILDRYAEVPVADREPMMFILDSLGNLSSAKEMQDTRDEKDTRDMTKAGLIRGVFRVLRLRLAKLNVPMILTNHVYAQIGAYVPTSVLSGGKGAVYASDAIALISKTKEKDKDKEVVGNIMHVKMMKSRLTKENSHVDVRVSYTTGLDRYYGLLDMLTAAGLVECTNGRYTFPGASKSVTESKIMETPEQYFTEKLLKQLDEEWVGPNFKYGSAITTNETNKEE